MYTYTQYTFYYYVMQCAIIEIRDVLRYESPCVSTSLAIKIYIIVCFSLP